MVAFAGYCASVPSANGECQPLDSGGFRRRCLKEGQQGLPGAATSQFQARAAAAALRTAVCGHAAFAGGSDAPAVQVKQECSYRRAG